MMNPIPIININAGNPVKDGPPQDPAQANAAAMMIEMIEINKSRIINKPYLFEIYLVHARSHLLYCHLSE